MFLDFYSFAAASSAGRFQLPAEHKEPGFPTVAACIHGFGEDEPLIHAFVSSFQTVDSFTHWLVTVNTPSTNQLDNMVTENVALLYLIFLWPQTFYLKKQTHTYKSIWTN